MDPAAVLPPLTFTAAAVLAAARYRALYVQTSAGDVFTCPSYLARAPKRALYGTKSTRSDEVPPDGYVTVSAAQLVGFLKQCVPPVPDIERMRASGPPLHLFNRVGLNALIRPTKQNELGWSWPLPTDFIHKLPPPAPVLPDMDLLDMLASTALNAHPEAGKRPRGGRSVHR